MPYAAPPIGDLRWAPPAKLDCKSGVSDAGRFGSMCPQVRPLSITGKVMGQEDCLFINVWTPTLQPDAKLPVMVWIHGGYLHMLSGGEQGYSPTEKLAADTGLVYVSFNYRLNAFGFLALQMLSGASPTNTSGQSVMHTRANAALLLTKVKVCFTGASIHPMFFSHQPSVSVFAGCVVRCWGRGCLTILE